MSEQIKTPINHIVPVTNLPASGRHVKLHADRDQLAKIASEVNVEQINALRAELKFRNWRKNGVSVNGTLKAELVQTCVITLEPVVNTIEEVVDLRFLSHDSKFPARQLNEEGEWLIDPEENAPEPFDGFQLDAWQIALDELFVQIDPFPRKENAHSPQIEIDVPKEETTPENMPFSDLKSMLSAASKKKT